MNGKVLNLKLNYFLKNFLLSLSIIGRSKATFNQELKYFIIFSILWMNMSSPSNVSISPLDNLNAYYMRSFD